MKYQISRVLFIAIIISLVTGSCRPDNVRILQEEFEYFCNAELISDDGTKFIDAHAHSIKYNNGQNRSDLHSFEGDYSLRLTPETPYGFTISIPKANADEYFYASAWRKIIKSASIGDTLNTKGVLVASADDFYTASNHVVETSPDGWEKIELEFFIPLNINDKIKLYVWNNGQDTVYFDNFFIQRKPKKDYPEFSIDSTFKIFYDQNAEQQINAKRYEAFQQGVLIVDDTDYQNAIVFSDDDYFECDIRLKGDWLDHIQGDKISFRVKTATTQAWRGMKSFSVQTPLARNFQHEWVLHKFLLNNDLLTTRFGFTPLSINGRSRGVYAWEEHFDKQLLESRMRREGPIVRFDETMTWKRIQLGESTGKGYEVPVFECAPITAFKQSRIIGDPLFRDEFIEAQSLMHQMQFIKTDVSDIFDSDKLSAFFVNNLLHEGFHGMAWHNIRYYYNPVLCRLEPITYDASYVPNIEYDFAPYFGQIENITEDLHKRSSVLLYWPLKDSIYMNSFYEHAKKFTNDTFLKQQFASIKKQLHDDEAMIKREYPYYKYNGEYIYRNAKLFREMLPDMADKISNTEYYKRAAKINFKPVQFSKNFYDQFIRHQIHVHRSTGVDGQPLLQVANFFGDTIKILSGKLNNQVFDKKYNEPLVVPPISEPWLATNFEVENHFDEVIVEIPSADKIIFVPITPWDAPKSLTSRQIVERSVEFPQSNYYTINGKTITFEGEIDIDKHVIIPTGYRVIFKAGTNIDIRNKATFVSYSPVFFRGTENNKIRVISSDHTARAFNVFQASETSKLRHVVFEGLSNLNFNGWFTPAAVCFYESDVEMRHVEFARNVGCDDALNMVRSHFDVDSCLFTLANADAFDSDFCTGRVANTFFDHPGNDGIDFSGSVIDIINCEVSNAEDKGISGGEGSTLTVRNAKIHGCNIGIASKDQSSVIVHNSKVNNNVYGLSAYVKKPEYGPGELIIYNVEFTDNMFFHLIEQESTLTIDNKIIKGDARNLVKRFY
ncbi:MAG: right-handed parallel beta-helix repeat-containing protein [Prolixibacteraceae bacterium]|jgi:hypothetical protein|nr:right-handed parallel beta-helix repeat-containing protein [Prolixibacteraceae bacterium]